MDYEKITARITELEQIEKDMNELGSQKRRELSATEAEANEIKKIINDNNFTNTDEYKELQKLKTTRKWLDIYNRDETTEE